ncbi:threonine--tRNA ligase [Proteiniclasticum sp. BAD-10]|uniref:Threonine--tRNA ligase n=1 Tax=Proteiniclasticum sediminis TaxID=2804028 RepID=A0A941HNV6_9CLOT|nr:threonine--tRNA ligase [Proteiniclasticum sediminis]MBR0574856.1 threonine--tRNA ligase [Proteiniclasticum sediminis]
MINVQLKDGSILQVENGSTVSDVAFAISGGLGRAALAGTVNGKMVDIRYPLTEDCQLEIKTFDDEEGKHAFRHTSSHILALAVKRRFPGVKLAIGPAIEDGYYYDFDKDGSFSAEDLLLLEDEMKNIVKEDLKLERFTLSREEALKLMEEMNEPYKVELIHDLPEDAVLSFYKMGEFVDLCAGPHVASTKLVKAFKLTQVAGAYWRGSEKNKMLTRIYGTSFPKKNELDEYLAAVEEAKKRDHNKLGRELDLFTSSEVIGQGLPLFKPKGTKILQLMKRFVEDEEESRGYEFTQTPLMSKSDLFKISGHWDHYKDGMFIMCQDPHGHGDLFDVNEDGEVMALRPMTCPFQFAIYNSDQHSYRDLPVRMGETSTLFRNESSGEMHGLTRVRQFTISEGHLIVRPDQLEDEFRGVLDLTNYIMETLGIKEDITYRFSKWDPKDTHKYINKPEAWEETQNIMRGILDHVGLNYVEAEGEAAFYGPKLDLQMKNVHGKEDTIITVQIDFALPERFNMTYVDRDGQKKLPYVIHRTSIGCYERTLASLIEKYAGAFPLWLAPVQVKLLPISEKYHDYVETVLQKMKNKGIRAEMDDRNEKIGYKIREARNERIPYFVVIGEQEQESGELSVTSREKGDEGKISLDAFIERILDENARKYNYHTALKKDENK